MYMHEPEQNAITFIVCAVFHSHYTGDFQVQLKWIIACTLLFIVRLCHLISFPDDDARMSVETSESLSILLARVS